MQDQFINPQQIRSPYTGETVRPVYNTYDANGKTYEQAVMSDPTTGHIIKKGLISIKDAKTGEVIQDYKSALSKSNTTQSRG
jgi:hypothetical protein|tara:strand:- start:253 stop:498 length:246 start_codon:yes stop_codon:yes gene_type:complete